MWKTLYRHIFLIPRPLIYDRYSIKDQNITSIDNNPTNNNTNNNNNNNNGTHQRNEELKYYRSVVSSITGTQLADENFFLEGIELFSKEQERLQSVPNFIKYNSNSSSSSLRRNSPNGNGNSSNNNLSMDADHTLSPTDCDCTQDQSNMNRYPTKKNGNNGTINNINNNNSNSTTISAITTTSSTTETPSLRYYSEPLNWKQKFHLRYRMPQLPVHHSELSSLMSTALVKDVELDLGSYMVIFASLSVFLSELSTINIGGLIITYILSISISYPNTSPTYPRCLAPIGPLSNAIPEISNLFNTGISCGLKRCGNV